MDARRGYVQAVIAYVLWGFFALYWHALREVPPEQIVAYRITLAALMLGGFGLFSSGKKRLPSRRALLVHVVAGLLIAANWLTFVYAVSVDRVLESSLGYFMTPLVSVVLAMVVLRERLTRTQWIAVLLATVGVVVLTAEAGVVPWIAFVLAFSFGAYGLVRKLSPLSSVEGLSVEVNVLVVPSMAFLVVASGGGELVVPSGWHLGLLLLAGAVTVTPLLLFAAAARSIPLSAVGLLQYINPLIQFVIGAFVFDESVSAGRFAGFAVIWLALVVFALDGWARRSSGVVVEPAPRLATK